MPLVFASKLFGTEPLPERVATSDLFFAVASLAEVEGLSFYLLGGDEATNSRAAKRVARLYPKLKLAGRRNGFFSRADEPAVVSQINDASPDILWVGMGVHRQEDFAFRNRSKLVRVGVLKTCGGCFRYLSGELNRAPRWMQDAGLEWLNLAMQDPGNRLMRYVRTNPAAIYRVMSESPLRLRSTGLR
jgi:exopolysaccharide biosynthesis WecB/TagA/CpsF family protein